MRQIVGVQDAHDQRAQQDAARGSAPCHCWIVSYPGLPDRWPGLLTAWEKTEHGWRGRVVFSFAADDGTVVIDRWIDVGHLRPAAQA